MAESEEFVFKEGDWVGEETEGAGMALGGGVLLRLAKDELMDGGGGRPGLDLNGGGRSGRSFILAGLEKKNPFICLTETNSSTAKRGKSKWELLPWRKRRV